MQAARRGRRWAGWRPRTGGCGTTRSYRPPARRGSTRVSRSWRPRSRWADAAAWLGPGGGMAGAWLLGRGGGLVGAWLLGRGCCGLAGAAEQVGGCRFLCAWLGPLHWNFARSGLPVGLAGWLGGPNQSARLGSWGLAGALALELRAVQARLGLGCRWLLGPGWGPAAGAWLGPGRWGLDGAWMGPGRGAGGRPALPSLARKHVASPPGDPAASAALCPWFLCLRGHCLLGRHPPSRPRRLQAFKLGPGGGPGCGLACGPGWGLAGAWLGPGWGALCYLPQPANTCVASPPGGPIPSCTVCCPWFLCLRGHCLLGRHPPSRPRRLQALKLPP
jgi:hypothetical protein